jgi:hypothetical protein
MSKYKLFNRDAINFKSVNERWSKIEIEIAAQTACDCIEPIGKEAENSIETLALEIKKVRENDRPVVLCMGAHPIKNGACLLINELVNEGLITHVAGNGASAIHDWEFARFGKSTECVKTNIEAGQFGLWRETGEFFGASAECACLDKQGWGEKIGELMSQGITFDDGSYEAPEYSVILNCFNEDVPFTIHPGIGQDIVHSHHSLTGNIGCAMIDFLIFCESIRNLEGGIYISLGSSVMSPMIFEKALSMGRNVEQQAGREIKNFVLAVNDLADNNWDWSQGEPPMSDPAYYLRWMKSFHRMGGDLQYFGLHNVSFLQHLRNFTNK